MKQKPHWLFHILCIGMFCLLATACFNEPTCLFTSSNQVRIAFRKVQNGLTDTLQVRGVVVTGIDSTYYENREVTRVLLPLNPEEETVLFFFDVEGEDQVMSMLLSYKVITRVLSPTCGIEKEYLDLRVVSTNFDSVRVINKTIDRNIATNIEIFR
jgi:hypothetical protein